LLQASDEFWADEHETFIDIPSDELDNNGPHLCSMCGRQEQWPTCMQDIKLRGYHSIYKNLNSDEVVECSNHVPCQ